MVSGIRGDTSLNWFWVTLDSSTASVIFIKGFRLQSQKVPWIREPCVMYNTYGITWHQRAMPLMMIPSRPSTRNS
ncbi:unnamed protein product [Fusarium graminearum]|uniref:Uncharacterized protein n=1 Tax=Gibberella zeae TaxID=5518 RepID=A0A4E9EIT3_GIBZA|nr:unnamed protein product [Fusarium graminearum]CAG1988920.1 unnamed protein product [Fusarium graminearum]